MTSFLIIWVYFLCFISFLPTSHFFFYFYYYLVTNHCEIMVQFAIKLDICSYTITLLDYIDCSNDANVIITDMREIFIIYFVLSTCISAREIEVLYNRKHMSDHLFYCFQFTLLYQLFLSSNQNTSSKLTTLLKWNKYNIGNGNVINIKAYML